MRKYAGERIGEGLVEATISVFPLVMAHFSEINTEDVAMLLEDDEGDLSALNVAEPVPAEASSPASW